MRRVLLVVVLLLFAVGSYSFWKLTYHPNPGTVVETLKKYTDEILGISFLYPNYPTSYYLEKKDLSTGERLRYTLVLIEDTEENRQLRKGKSPTPREGPTAITIDLFQNNLDKQTAIDWVKGSSDSNFKLGDQTYSSATIDQMEAVRYRWSGLYEGESVVAADEKWIYMLSVTYLTPQDRIRPDFSKVVDTFKVHR